MFRFGRVIGAHVIGAHACDFNADCHNSLGSYECQCKPGYEGDGRQICAVSDECLLGEHLCHEKADCTDLDDQYRCDCWPGYQGENSIEIKKLMKLYFRRRFLMCRRRRRRRLLLA